MLIDMYIVLIHVFLYHVCKHDCGGYSNQIYGYME